MITAILKHKDFQAELSKRITVREEAGPKPNGASSKVWHGFVGTAFVVAAVFAVARFTPSFAVAPAEMLSAEPTLPSVATATAERSQQKMELALPAEIDAWQATSVYARIKGYMKSWKADRGDRVEAGQVLAVIDAPEFDQELRRSQADLLQGKAEAQQARTALDEAKANVDAGQAQIVRAEANLQLAAKTVERFKGLSEKWAATVQQYDESLRNYDATKAELVVAKADLVSRKAIVNSRQAAINTAEARVNSLAATVQRLKELEGFKTITAPFAGTITRRLLDVGALITDDASKPLFTVIQDDVLRVRVNVPQTYAPSIQSGQNAALTLREFPGRKFAAKVSRTARSIDPSARTLTTELELPNADRMVLAGSFAQVHFALDVENAPLTIPASTLKMTKDGTRVAVVGNDHQIHFQTVEIGRDLGARVEIVTGLKGGETLVINPADSLSEGTKVEAIAKSAVATK
jgi:RND family efflux transporter MFP subunit